MSFSKSGRNRKIHSKKEKQLIKLINNSDSESECSEHELSYYLNDRVKLMKEVLKIIKPKKIRSMAPDSIKNSDNEEINSMLLEELLGISNKRLKYIFNGQSLEEDSSSTDPEEEQQQQPIDIISLDDISDDDFIDLDSDATSEKKSRKKSGKTKVKTEPKKKKIKKEKQDKSAKGKTSKKSNDEENLMSVLELLELQARARAIRSQLVIESNKKAQEKEKNVKVEESDHDDAVIVDSPKNIEIVITSSESETEVSRETASHHIVIENSVEEPVENPNVENTKDSEENSNQPVVVTTYKNEETIFQNLSISETLEKQVRGSGAEINKKGQDAIGVKNIESNVIQNLNTEQNKSDSIIENSEETGIVEEKIGHSVKHHKKANTDESISEKEKKSQSIELNAQEDDSIRANISQDIFIVDSESDSDIKLNRNIRKRGKKVKKDKIKRSNGSDLEIDNKKLKTKSRREGCKHKTIVDRELEIRVSKNEREVKIKKENEKIVAEQTKVRMDNIPIHRKSNHLDEGEGIVINMDQSEIDYIISD